MTPRRRPSESSYFLDLAKNFHFLSERWCTVDLEIVHEPPKDAFPLSDEDFYLIELYEGNVSTNGFVV